MKLFVALIASALATEKARPDLSVVDIEERLAELASHPAQCAALFPDGNNGGSAKAKNRAIKVIVLSKVKNWFPNYISKFYSGMWRRTDLKIAINAFELQITSITKCLVKF